MIFQVQYDTRTRAHRPSLTAWGPLPACVVAPLPPINRRAADSESDAGLVLPLRNSLPSLFCTNEDWKIKYHPRHPFVHDGARPWMPNARLHLLLEATAMQERRLAAVRFKPLFGPPPWATIVRALSTASPALA